jgi:hypothetical protein
MYTEDPDIETCDFRLTTIDTSNNSTNVTKPVTTTSGSNATNATKVQLPAI